MTRSTGVSCHPATASSSRGSCLATSGNCSDASPMNQDFVDLLRAFKDADVRFLVVGAYALAHHGRPRATGDLDVWVDATPVNAPRVMRALAAFGAPLRDVSEPDFAHSGMVLQIGVPPGRIDVLTDLTGLQFADAWAGRETGMFGPLTVDFLGKAAFLQNKRATGRTKDLADIEGL